MARRNYKHIRRIVIPRYVLYGAELQNLTVFVRSATGAPLLLPLLFSAFLAKNGFIYREQRGRRKSPTFEPSFLSDSSVQNYLSCLHLFLDTLEEFSATSLDRRALTASGDNVQLVSQSLVSTYLNEFLPQHCGSPRTLTLHRAALQAFFDWLSYFGFVDGIKIPLRRASFDRLSKPAKSKEGVVQYISREFRRQLLCACKNKRDRLILRAGFEVGLRAGENHALILPDQRIGSSKKPGLLSLFESLDKADSGAALQYWLHGKYCKSGKSRPVTLSDSLLRSMREYYTTERRKALASSREDSPHLFVSYSRNGDLGMSRQFPTTLFRSLRSRVPQLDPRLSYHDLRHTFATELYASLVTNSVNSDKSRALTIVQDCLGHASSSSTEMYVHLFESMQAIENSDRNS